MNNINRINRSNELLFEDTNGKSLLKMPSVTRNYQKTTQYANSKDVC